MGKAAIGGKDVCEARWPLMERGRPPEPAGLQKELAEAIRARDAEAVGRLAAAGADPKALPSGAVDGREETPLGYAAREMDLALVQALLAAGADPKEGREAWSGRELPPLAAYAVWQDREDILAALAQAGAPLGDPAAPMSLAMFAARDGSIRCLRLLASLDPDCVGRAMARGATPLMVAAKNGQGECAAALLGWGADAGALDSEGESAKAMAVGDALAPFEALEQAHELRACVPFAAKSRPRGGAI